MQGIIERFMDPDAPRSGRFFGSFKMNEGKAPNPEYVAYMQEKQKKIDAIGGQQKIIELRNQARAQGMGFLQAGRWVNQQIKSLYAASMNKSPTPPAAAPAAPAASPAAPVSPVAAAPAPAPATGGLVGSAMGGLPSAQQTALQGSVKTVDVPEVRGPQGTVSSLSQVRR